MKKYIFLYGIALAAFMVVLKFIEQRLFVSYMDTELYFGLFAFLFIGLGIWLGIHLMRYRRKEHEKTPLSSEEIDRILSNLEISKREAEVLELIAKGHSNSEIASILFVSVSTIKTHSSNLFAKLDVKRRTQAVQKAKELNII